MELTTGVQQIQDRYLTTKKQSGYYYANNDIKDDIIDVDAICFDNDETWLYSVDHSEATRHRKCFNEENMTVSEFLNCSLEDNRNDSHRNIDTRTFTRPKKRYTRPSIEKYNKELYGTGDKHDNFVDVTKKSLDSGIVIESNESNATKPLHFDLAQPTSSYYFENVFAKASEADSFQSMSPPSLVNSMSSSIFTNLMESSFIKNDPELREIRDKDFSDSILLQDCEPPLFQSITDSISSVNSDTPEAFLKKINNTRSFNWDLDSKEKINATFELNPTFDKTPNNKTESKVLEETADDNYLSIHNYTTYKGTSKHDTFRKSDESKLLEDTTEDKYLTIHNYTTYRRTPKHSNTFRKSDGKRESLNATFLLDINDVGSDNSDSPKNRTFRMSPSEISGSTTITKDNSAVLKQKLLEDMQHINDMNKVSYCITRKSNGAFTNISDEVQLKRNSIGSADSLDRMSSLSNSSRGSNKMLNMSDVDAIVEMQEKSLQVMSTPKPNSNIKKVWDSNFISPIPPENNFSDSDEDYKTVRSNSKASLDNHKGGKPSNKFEFQKPQTQPKKVLTKNVFTIPSSKKVVSSNLRGSYSNLNTMSTLGSSQSNLKTMGHKLKGSYTSLRPISANLPVAPPPLKQQHAGLNSTITLPKATNHNVTQIVEPKVAEVYPIPKVPASDPCLKPRMSGLPRPVAASGLPRPISRIPAPKSNIRTVSKSASYMERH